MGRIITKEPMVTIEMPLKEISPDPIQFKPYFPHIAPTNVMVSVSVPQSEVTINGSGKSRVYVLTPRGVALACKQVATAIANVYQEQDKPTRQRY